MRLASRGVFVNYQWLIVNYFVPLYRNNFYIKIVENNLLNRLDGLSSKFDEISTLITDPAIIADTKRFVKLNKEYADLEKIIKKRDEYSLLLKNLQEATDLLATEKDEELREMARQEIDAVTPRIEPLEEEIKLLLVPADPQDGKNAIVEIRGGTGGDEAAIFAGDLFKMYARYCESRGWKTEVTSFTVRWADTKRLSSAYRAITYTVH